MPLPLVSMRWSYGASPSTALLTSATSAADTDVSPVIRGTGAGSMVMVGCGWLSGVLSIGVGT